MHQLIKRFGLRTIDLGGGRTDRTRSVLYFRNRYYRAEELAEDFEAFAPLLHRQFQEAGFPTTYAHSTPEGVRLDHLSVYEWIEQYVEGGHTVAVGHLLDHACTSLYGLDSREQSALNLVYLFGSPDPARGSIASGPMQASRKIMGGNEQLPLALARSLPEGWIQLSYQLVALERTSDASLTLMFAVAGGTLQVQCDCAILALPFSALRHVDYRQAGFDPLKQLAIEELGYGTISKLFLQFDRPYWYEHGPGLTRPMALSSRTWIFRRSGTLPVVKPAQVGCLSIIRADTEELHMRHRRPIPRLLTPHTSSSMPRTACSNWSLSSLASAFLLQQGR